jgi:hypothetical protein
MRQAVTSWDRRPRSTATTQLSDISRLSAIASELVAIRQHLTHSDDVVERLDDIVVRLDATVTTLFHAAPMSADDR